MLGVLTRQYLHDGYPSARSRAEVPETSEIAGGWPNQRNAEKSFNEESAVEANGNKSLWSDAEKAKGWQSTHSRLNRLLSHFLGEPI